jgi:hypothetical protein
MAVGLDPCDLDAFVGLDVWAETDVISTRYVDHSLGVTFDAIDVEEEARGS